MSALDLATGGIWKYATLGVGVVGLIATACVGLDDFGTHRALGHTQDQLTKAQKDLATEEINNLKLIAAVDKQNTATLALKVASDAKLAASDRAVADYQVKNHDLEAKVSRLKVPLRGATTCDRAADADRLLLESIK